MQTVFYDIVVTKVATKKEVKIMETIIQIMKKYHFSEMETLVYTTLLEQDKLTGYEISKQSGVPRSKVYNILEKLLKKNLVIVNKSEPKLYRAVSSSEFIERLEREVNQDMLVLDKQLGSIKEVEEEELLWKIEGYSHVLEKVEHVIKHSKKSLLVQIWKQDMTNELLLLLQTAEKQLDECVVILFDQEHKYDLPLTHYYKHGFEEDKLSDFGSRWINVVSDETEVVFGTLSDDGGLTDVTWTKNKAMVSLSKEYVKHDAYTLKIIEELPQELRNKYGQEFKQVRSIFKGE